MLTEDEQTALVAGAFELDCLEMTLRQKRDVNPVEYSGPGEIRQSLDGSLNVRLFDAKADPPSLQLYPIGEFLPDDAYFELTALDTDGRTWSGVLLPDAEMGRRGGCLLRGKPRRIVSMADGDRRRTNDVLELMVPAELEFAPTTVTEQHSRSGSHSALRSLLDTAEFDANGLKFHCRAHSGRTDVVASAEAKAVSQHAYVRIIEALQFLLGRAINPVLVERRTRSKDESIVFAVSFSRAGRSSGIGPPAPIGPGAFRTSWALFDKYLAHVWQHDGETFHPLSTALDSVVNSAGTSLDTQALVLAVAVEAVLKVTDEAVAELPLSTDERKMKTLIQAWRRFLREEGVEKHVRDRLFGFFSSLLGRGADRRLRYLLEIGAVSEPLIDTWRALRNRRTHGAYGDLKERVKMLAECDATLQLLYQIIFHAIGYHGHCFAYGERLRPIRLYPPEKVASSSIASGRTS